MSVSNLPGKLRKAIPYVVVLGFVFVTGSTEWFSTQLHEQVLGQLQTYGKDLMPFALNLCMAFLVVYTAYLAFGGLRAGFDKCLTKTAATDKGRHFCVLIFQAVFWIAVVLVAMRIVAPKLLQEIMLSGGIIAGVVLLAAQKGLGNVMSSIWLHLAPNCAEGDFIKIDDVKGAEGKIIAIGYLSCKLLLANGQVMVIPNGTLWEHAVTVGEPPPDSKLPEPMHVQVELVRPAKKSEPVGAVNAAAPGTIS